MNKDDDRDTERRQNYELYDDNEDTTFNIEIDNENKEEAEYQYLLKFNDDMYDLYNEIMKYVKDNNTRVGSKLTFTTFMNFVNK